MVIGGYRACKVFESLLITQLRTGREERNLCKHVTRGLLLRELHVLNGIVAWWTPLPTANCHWFQMWKAIGIIWRYINQNNCNCKVLWDDDDGAANNNGFCLHELCTRRRTLFAFCDQYHLSRWKDSLPPVIRLVSSRHPSQLERRKTVGCISLLKRPVISYCTQHCLCLHIVQVAAFLFSSIHTADDDSMIPISNWNQSLVHIHFLSFCSKLAFLLFQNSNLRL